VSPQRSSSKQDVSEKFADRLAELDTVSDDSSSTRVTPQQHSEPKKGSNGIFADEHSLIAQYCQNLNNGDYTSIVPDSPMQLMEEINHDQTRELEHMIRELESENATLQEEYVHLKATTTSSSSSGTTTSGVSVSTFTSGAAVSSAAAEDIASKANDILNEAKLLREHKERLESRMKILEEHNQQLMSQLGKLKRYSASSLSGDGLSATSANKTGTLNIKSVTASQLAQNSPLLPHKMNGHYINLQSTGPSCGVNDSDHRCDPPALPPRGVPRPKLHEDSQKPGTRAVMKPIPPAVPPKRSSLTRSELALYSDQGCTSSPSRHELHLQNPRSRDVVLNRIKVPNINGGSGGRGHLSTPLQSWTDSLPRRDFYNFLQSGNTSSLPRRDKAGLGRPEPVSNGRKPGRDFGTNRELPGFVGVKGSLCEKRNSTGNLYFTDTIGQVGQSESRPHSRQSVKSMSGYISNRSGVEDSQVTNDLKNVAGDLGKELKNLISIMDQEEAAEAVAANARTAKYKAKIKK